MLKERGRQTEADRLKNRQKETDGLKETGRQTDKQTEGDRLLLHVKLAY